MTDVNDNVLFRVIDVTEGDTKKWAVYVPVQSNLRFNLQKLKQIIDLYLEDLPNE